MSEILDDMFDEALRFEQESDDTDEHCGEIVIQSSEFCALHARIKELEEECERERLRLAACGVAAMSNTERTIENRRLPEDNPYYSASYSDVVRMVEREITQRARIRELEALVENAHKKLSEYIIPCRDCDDGIDEAVCTCGEPRHEFERLLEVIKALEARG